MVSVIFFTFFAAVALVLACACRVTRPKTMSVTFFVCFACVVLVLACACGVKPWCLILLFLCFVAVVFQLRAPRNQVFGSPAPLPTVAAFTQGLGWEERIAWEIMPKYTDTGSKQLPLPDDLRRDLQSWYRETPRDPEEPNSHLVGDVRICSLSGTQLEDRLRDFLKEELERWTGQRGLLWTNSYGPREYRRGATLAAHSDRIRSHAISAIVYVDSEEIEEPWALQFVPNNADKQDTVLEVFLRPGAEVLLYEGTLPHGRIKPLKGRAFAATFFHWAPKGWRERAEELVGRE